MHGLNYENGRYCFTRAADTPAAWHGLGGETPAKAPLEVWLKNSGMDFEILKRTSEFQVDEKTRVVANKKNAKGDEVAEFCGLIHSRSKKVLDQVGANYVVHQPREIAETFKKLCDTNGFTMDTMGVLHGGKRFWGLASNEMYGKMSGNSKDVIKPYLLLASGCEMATTAQLTTVRVVCQNTLHMSLSDTASLFKQRHTSAYNEEAMARALGLEEAFGLHMDTLEKLAAEKIGNSEGVSLILDLFAGKENRDKYGDDLEAYPTKTQNTVKKIVELNNGTARGTFENQRGTKIQMLNAITEFVDHHQPRKGAAGLVRNNKTTDAIWWGAGAKTKEKAFKRLALAA